MMGPAPIGQHGDVPRHPGHLTPHPTQRGPVSFESPLSTCVSRPIPCLPLHQASVPGRAGQQGAQARVHTAVEVAMSQTLSSQAVWETLDQKEKLRLDGMCPLSRVLLQGRSTPTLWLFHPCPTLALGSKQARCTRCTHSGGPLPGLRVVCPCLPTSILGLPVALERAGPPGAQAALGPNLSFLTS